MRPLSSSRGGGRNTSALVRVTVTSVARFYTETALALVAMETDQIVDNKKCRLEKNATVLRSNLE